MRILNLGSLNIDRIYSVEKFVQPKETIKALKYQELCGGKGLNQSVALAKAGVEVYHAGIIGYDGKDLIDIMENSGVCVEYIQQISGASGHAVIQVNEDGQNNIIIYGGTNDCLTRDYIDSVLDHFDENDAVLLQNETSNVDYVITKAKEKGLMVIFNPSPMNEVVYNYPLELVDFFILNEVEGRMLAGSESEDSEIIMDGLKKRFPKASFVLTLGEKGSVFFNDHEEHFQDIFHVEVIDTTGAGDTFCGYFLAELVNNTSYQQCLKVASAASAIKIGRKGAAPGIPEIKEVRAFLNEREILR